MTTDIYERADWPHFTWDAAKIAQKLAAVRNRQGRLTGRMEELGFKLKSEANLEALTEEVTKSSEIEGKFLSRKQVRSSLARRLGVDIGALTPAERNVEGIVEVMLDATGKYNAPLTSERLFGWHAALFPTGRSGMYKITVGAWRKEESGPMQVVSGPIGREHVHYEAPKTALLTNEMKAFIDWFNGAQDIDLVLKAAIAHLWFVIIHPFENGNGRIARAIADMALARSENSPQRFYSMSAQIRQEHSVYYDILEATQKGELDTTDWLEWFLDCLDRAFDRADVILASVHRNARFWKTHANQKFNDRQRTMIGRLFEGFEGKLTSSKWAQLTKSSQDTAQRDIADLLAKGVLAKEAAGGRSTSYSLIVGEVETERQAN
jgi:Fic family protein